MAQTLTFSREQLLILTDSLRAQNPGLTQSQLTQLAQTDIRVNIPISRVTASEPPRLALPQRIVSLQLGTTVYTDPVQWTQRWRSLFSQAESRGVTVTRGQYLLDISRDLVTVNNLPVAVTAAPAAVNTQQFVSDVVVTDVEILSSAVVVEFSNGTSRSLPILGPQGPKGDVGPGATFSIGTVVESAVPTVTAVGSNGNYQLNFGLKTGPASDIMSSGSYSDPSWIVSLSKNKVGLSQVTDDAQLKIASNLSDLSDPAQARVNLGLNNVTNESKATMFANPTFTGTVNLTNLSLSGTATGITAAMVGLGNVTNESKATMFANPTFTGTTEITSLGVGVTASGVTGEIRATNEITAYYSSDLALKQNVTPIAQALDKLSQITGVMFDWRDEVLAQRGGEDGFFVRRHDTGIIAQDVEQVLPEIVATRPDGTLAVKYEKLAGLIIEAIKELRTEIKAIQRKLQ